MKSRRGLSYSAFLAFSLVSWFGFAAPARAAGPCACNGDVDDNGLIQVQDWIAIRECMGGDCSFCVNSCDLNCDGKVDDLDAGPDLMIEDNSVFYCLWVGISPEVCCAAPVTGACCVGEECKEVTADDCAGAAGTYLGDDTTCGLDTCAPPPPTGACCTGEVCEVHTADACASQGGEYLGDGTACTAETCAPPPTGACCLTFDCAVLTADQCSAKGGWYQGDGTGCTETTCAPPPCTCDGDVDGNGLIQVQDWIAIRECMGGDCSACVNSCDLNCDGLVNDDDAGPDPTVDDSSVFYCFFVGISPEVCCAPPATGACCVGEECSELTEDACASGGGAYQGDATVCTAETCVTPPDPTGACCITFDCVVDTAAGCDQAGGAYQGDDTTCTEETCAGPPCTCDGDVDGNGLIQVQDWIAIRECMGGDCSACVNSCDLNCDGLVNNLDAGPNLMIEDNSVFYCLWVGISPEVCCAAPVTGACCVGEECKEVTADDCAGVAGTYLGDDTTCGPETCAPPPPPTGACCTGEVCEVLTADGCASEGGEYLGDGTACTAETCVPPPTGACCLTFDCFEATADKCDLDGGAYQGDQTTCTEETCAPPPCTCDGDVDGNGLIQVQDWIAIRECMGGDCSACVNSCDLNCDGLVNDDDAGPDPTVDDSSVFYCFFVGMPAEICCGGGEEQRGACCLGEECVVLTAPNCAKEGGAFQGDKTECMSNTCTVQEPGACCVEGGCLVLTGAVCDAEGGEFLGKGAPCSEGVCDVGGPSGFATGLRNRYLSFATGEQPQVASVRVDFVDLPAPFDLYNGTSMWVGAPGAVAEDGASVEPGPGSDTYQSATLQCTPYLTNWQAAGTVFVRHEDIVPGGTYRIGFVDASMTLVGSAMLVTMSRWGDLAGVYDPGGWWAAPDGSIDIGSDVLGAIAKFANAPIAMRKSRVDVEPAMPDQIINISDILKIIGAYQGLAFPFAPGAPPCGG